jgi:DNA-binding response OmpR family regulator
MVVDDDPLQRALIASHLAAHSATAIEFDDAVPALATLRTEHFDLLITELHLPGEKDGLWLLDQARHHLPDLPIIIITETPPERPHLRAADAIVEKPFHPDELLGNVLELLR